MVNKNSILYKEVKITRDLIYGKDFKGEKNSNIKNGSIGTVVDIIDDEWCSVEFFKHNDHPVLSVKFVDLEEIN